ncbi:GIY-YIG nuclease family protein [bacterium]|nr:GIY-YIG nuclease family protein [bacterium]|tara:strand:- start:16 stop:429 length:414 start_codon:yes stop_codon:yes gene_type:complete
MKLNIKINTNNTEQVLKTLSNINNIKHVKPLYPNFDKKVSYKLSNNFFIPKREGVYFVHDMRGFLYIGESNNLRNRFLQHLQREKNSDLTNLIKYPFGDLSFYWVTANTKLEAVKLQKYWIRILKPFTNKINYIKNS